MLEPQPVEVAPAKISVWRRVWLWILRLFGRDHSAPAAVGSVDSLDRLQAARSGNLEAVRR